MNARALLDEAVRTLKASDALDHWQRGRERIEAEDRLSLVFDGHEPEPRDVGPAARGARFRRLVDRRATGEPVPYIKGFADFRGLDILAKPGVFVPRDSSEFLAEQAVRRLRGRRRPVHLDVACGSGAIALSVKHDVPRATVIGTDLAADAVRLARRNADALRLKATFVRGDLFAAVPARLRGRVDVITLHPPYVAAGEVEHLPEEIREWEPVHTLTDRSEDGLGLVSATAREAPSWLEPTGWLLVEVSPDRAGGVIRVLREAGFRDVERTKGGPIPVTRVVVGRRPR